MHRISASPLANPISGHFFANTAPAKILALFTRFEQTCKFEIFAFGFCFRSDITYSFIFKKQACTALAERCPASAVRREVVLTDHGRTCWCRRSDVLQHSVLAAAHQ